MAQFTMPQIHQLLVKVKQNKPVQPKVSLAAAPRYGTIAAENKSSYPAPRVPRGR